MQIDTSRYPQLVSGLEPVAEAKKELYKAVAAAHEVLVGATTVFPFTLFPDTVTVDREKLTINHRVFFKSVEAMSIAFEDILNVTASVGPIFGTIKILTRFFELHKPYTLNYFWRKDALRIKRVMQGYIIALQKNIDCSALSATDLSKMLDELGKSADDERL